MPQPESIETHHYADAAILPGLVNTHTHLELTGFAGMNDNNDFWEWIKRIIALKATRSESEFFDAACRGIEQCWAAGVTTIADMGNTGSVIAAMHHLGAAGIAYHEAFDLHTEPTDRVMRRFEIELDRLGQHAIGRVLLGASPHAPYTVSGPLYRAVAQLARAHGIPIGVHVAEPLDESRLLDDFTGVFAQALKARGVARVTDQPYTPIAWLDHHGVLGNRTLCAHAIHTDETDTDIMVRRDVAVAHCPRSNRRHHHADAPLRRYLDRGLRVGIGTDSEVSVAPIDLVAEACVAQQLASWSDADALRALTLGGAAALGLDSICGSITAGKSADLMVVSASPATPPALADLSRVQETWLAGRRVYRRQAA